MRILSEKRWQEIKASIEGMIKALQKAEDRAVLISIERDGRLNKFTFVRGKEIYVIETMGVLSDDVLEWKEKLLDVKP